MGEVQVPLRLLREVLEKPQFGQRFCFTSMLFLSFQEKLEWELGELALEQLNGPEQALANQWFILLTFKMSQMRPWCRQEDVHSAAPVVAQEPTSRPFPKAVSTRLSPRGLPEHPHQKVSSSRTAVTITLYNQPSVWQYSEESPCLLVFVTPGNLPG